MSSAPPPPPPSFPPPPPQPTGGPKGAWGILSRGWKIGLGAAGAFLVILLVSLAAGGGETTTTVTERVAAAPAEAAPAETVTRTVTATRTVRAPAAAAPAEPARPAARALEYSGNGSRNVGTITVAEDSTLRWTNDGDIFQIFDDGFGLSVNSQGASGETFVGAGSYTNVTVNAIGNWTITITPGS